MPPINRNLGQSVAHTDATDENGKSVRIDYVITGSFRDPSVSGVKYILQPVLIVSDNELAAE